MLILAGVSINAVVGDNGILTKTQYASFLNEMAAVEEAVQLWKTGETIEANGENIKLIPANGLCKANELMDTERLVGEVGYYRIWSMSEKQPTTNILSDASTFNSAFESELVFYPAGVQDLYYLNNDALEIKGNKTYLIDASTGMIYSMTGIGLKGVRCYSSSMAKAVMNGESTVPLFAEAEVSGTGSEEKLAGNVTTEYLMDENGNYILDESGNKINNPEYNPYGFKIIADWRNDNVYKLYNNGDLYGKGIKGTLLNTSEAEMDSINAYTWQEFNIPEIIPNTNGKAQIISGYYTIYVIDSEGYLWAWGINSYNKLGLPKESQIEYTGKVPTKLNVDGKKVYKVYPNIDATYVVTKTDNVYELYACGYNTNGELGIGNLETSQEAFTKVEFDHPEQIISIASPNYSQVHWSLILADRGTENKIYFAGGTDDTGEGGVSKLFKGTDKENTNITKYIEIFNDVYGAKFETKIKDIIRYDTHKTCVLFVDENDNLIRFSGGQSTPLSFEDSDNSVEKVVVSENPGVMLRINTDGEREVWAFTRNASESGVWGFGNIGGGFKNITEYVKMFFNPDDIKDVYSSEENCWFILKDGKVWAIGNYSGTGSGRSSGTLSGFTCVNDISNLPLIDSIVSNNNNFFTSTGTFCFKGKDGKLYSTGNGILMFGENTLQKSWIKIATNVKKFNATTYANCLAYIDMNNDIWICGSDSWLLGTNTENVEKISNFKLLKEYLKDEEIYSHIDGKVEDYYFDCANFYIKTNSADNDTLYASGYFNAENWTEQYLGLGESVDAKIPTLILEDVKDFYVGRAARFCIMNDGTFQCWGSNNGSQLSGVSSFTPKQYLQDGIDFSNVNKIYSWPHGSNMFMNDGTVYITGNGITESDTNGLGYDVDRWTIFPQNELITNDSIKQLAYISRQSKIYLTEKGKLWGTGILNTLGINSTSSSINYNLFAINNIDNVLEIVGGNGFYILIKNDGTVWGTGSNINGILGRWVGVDRSTPNSRYKTAFEWVECPELEI